MKILYLPNQYSQQRQHEKKRWIYPVRMAMEAEYYRKRGHTVMWKNPIHRDKLCSWDRAVYKAEGLPFLSLPVPDRTFTKAKDKRYQQNGNFKYRPGTYIQVANGCWHGKCTFCVERNNKWEVRPVTDVVNEIVDCAAMGFREVFDDSGTFPTGKWLDDFLVALNKKFCKQLWNIRLGCNMRMVDVDYMGMAQAGFRMVLFGLESANQKTLDKINKEVQVDDHKYIIKAAKAGLEPHIAVMFGYPWETDDDALRTLRLVHWLLKKGFAKTAQASFFNERVRGSNEQHRKFVGKIYGAAYSPTFWLTKLRDIHDLDDLKYLWRMIKEGISNA